VQRKNLRATLNDVAREARVSTATVSRCLNLPDKVSPEVRERVHAAVNKLGYVPHFGGRALASNRSNTVGAVIPTMENAIFARGLQALEEALSAKGITLLVATSNYDVDREAAQIRTLLGRGVDGLVLIGASRPQETYEVLRKGGVPFVLVWNPDGDSRHCSVGFDNRGAARGMTEQVLAIGHRHVAMIAGITAWNDRASDRVLGVREALAAHDLVLAEPYLVEAVYSLSAGGEAAQRLWELTPRPTAIVCGNDVLAVGAIIGLRAIGVTIPSDVSVVGFDDIDLALAVSPALTTVHVPHRRMGRSAADLLYSMIRSGGSIDRITFDTEIVFRHSLAGIAQS
jgi:LacI family transcriptional regulator